MIEAMEKCRQGLDLFNLHCVFWHGIKSFIFSCIRLAEDCGGITKGTNGRWALRSGTTPKNSPTKKEISALKSCFSTPGM